MERFLIPHPSIPNHYDVSPSYLIRTTDLDDKPFKWSRAIRSNYIPGHGFLCFKETERIEFYGFEVSESTFYMKELNAGEVSSLIHETIGQSLAILHYNPQGYIQTIITGIQPNVFENFPEQYRSHYHDL